MAFILPAPFELINPRDYFASVRFDFRGDFVTGAYVLALDYDMNSNSTDSYLEIKNVSTGEITTKTCSSEEYAVFYSPVFSPAYEDTTNSYVTFAIRMMGGTDGCKGTVRGVYLYQIK